MLTDNIYLTLYRSLHNDFDAEFMIPSYKHSVLLERGSGYFTVNSLVRSFDGILHFLHNGGDIHLICNPSLSEEDIQLIEAGEKLDASFITSDLIRAIEDNEALSEDDIDKLDVICNMIAERRLIIKIAYLPDGIYHEKFGIFSDSAGNQVYFNGSANETLSAKIRNVESFTVITSWSDPGNFIESEQEYFSELWNNNSEGVTVIPFPEAVEQKLFENYRTNESLDKAVESYLCKKTGQSKRTLYDYQAKAINEFVKNGYRHFYEMATGTGKTFTAIKTIERVSSEVTNSVFAVICVPQIDLQAQWNDELIAEGHTPYLLGGLKDGKSSDQEFDKAFLAYARCKKKVVVCVSVYETFFSRFYDKATSINDLFVIFDEAHNLSPQQISRLPYNAIYRLGLSATIERFNQSETKKILSFFLPERKESFKYTIEQAIDSGFLSHYEYFPIYVELSTDEYDQYQQKSKAIATLMGQDPIDEEELNKRRTERSLIVKQAENKIPRLSNLISDGYDFVNSVVYCGQGKQDENTRIIDNVTQILHSEGNYIVSQFTSRTPDRVKVLQEFEYGFFDTLVAIKCFDEGVDCPKLDKIYIMASDTSVRQTVQRRGRVLRKCKETGKTIARIFDMITLPPSSIPKIVANKYLVVGELRRAKEYARLADNKEDVLKRFDKLEQQFDITEEDYTYED